MASVTKPVIFLAFANDRDDTVGYLRNLPDEARRLRDVLELAEQAGLCEVEVRSNSTASDIFKVFQDPKYRNRIAIFHFGGHANGYQLLLESAAGQAAAADAGGLAAFLAQQQGLQLVFLNGCSTQQQTQGLLDANIPAVISTSRSIDDNVATDFACQFYQGLAGGATIRTAFNEAAAAARTAEGGDTRALYFGSGKDPQSGLEADRWPWNLDLREGSERAAQWNLPDAVNDPLFGLPPLPKQDLPESPYRHLNWFTRGDAEVFFGRGHQIRELYDRLTAPHTAPIILFYGQSGVGKSSLLVAGLIPRLERDYEVRYVRRTAQGLLDTLRSELSPESSQAPVEVTWRSREEQTGKPLIVFLDQIEESYTRKLAEVPDELDQLLQVLQTTFSEIDRRPKGKLVLGFREEWLAKLESRIRDYRLPRNKVFLEPLDRRGIIEVVEGPASDERLVTQYGLTIENDLARVIADDLLADRESAIAPTLQILLTKMWAKAKEENNVHPRLSHDLYHQLKRDGILLRDFLTQQIAAFRERDAEAVESGLLLDVLAMHTTPLGTANQWTDEQLNEQYRHCATLRGLLQHCKDLHLLTAPPGTLKATTRTTRLAHDTLAPLVRERFEQSDKPGQRARRILDSRSVDWQDDNEGSPLHEADLAIVERGLCGTRSLSNIEQKLVDASRELRHRRKRTQTLLGVASVLGIMLILGLTAWSLHSYVSQREQRRLTDALTMIENYGRYQKVGTSPSQERAVVFNSLPSDGDIMPLIDAIDVLKIKNLDFGELNSRHRVSNELLTELSRLSGLRRLKLKGQQKLSSFRPLATLTNLMELDLSGTQIEEMPPIADLPNLKVLKLNDTPGMRKVVIANHDRISEVHLDESGVEKITLTELPNLKLLNAGQVRSLFELELSGLPNLIEVAIKESRLPRIELVSFPSLTNIYVSKNPELRFLEVNSCNNCKLLDVSEDKSLQEIRLLSAGNDMEIDGKRKETRVKTDSKKLREKLAELENVSLILPTQSHRPTAEDRTNK